MQTKSKIRTITSWVILVILLCVISFMTGINYSPIKKIEIQFDSITYKHKVDSFNRVISENKKTVTYLLEQKSKIKQKFDTIYRYLDNTSYDEILWEHGLLDDTISNVPDTSIVLFRLVQGAEARALNKINEITIKRLELIISDLEEARQHDSTAIAVLITDNGVLINEIGAIKSDLERIKSELDSQRHKNRSTPFKSALIDFGFFIGGVFVGLIK